MLFGWREIGFFWAYRKKIAVAKSLERERKGERGRRKLPVL
jgi:hypothetical protein